MAGVALFCSPANPNGLVRFILREADIIKSHEIVVDRPELSSPLALTMVIIQLFFCGTVLYSGTIMYPGDCIE